MYERNPWKRLQRTLILTYTMTFGTKAEAHAAADKINDVHTRINGVDPVTGKPYDALDPELLLYVHACLVDSALLFEELTVGALDDAGRQRFHEEQMLAAELCLVPRAIIPPTVPALRAWLADVDDRGDLQVTDGARRVLDLFFEPPAEAEWRPVLRGVSRLAFGDAARTASGRCTALPFGPVKRAAMRATFPAIRAARPLLPPKFRYIAPYQECLLRQQGIEPGDEVAEARKRAGIRLVAQGAELRSWETAAHGRWSTSTGCCSTSTACW